MKVALFSPYGALHEEAGLIYLVGALLASSGARVFQVTCNGVFSLCDRDAEIGLERSLTTCLECMGEQARLAMWSSLERFELSTALTPEEILRTKEWVSSLPPRSLHDAEFDGAPLFDLCTGSLRNRYGSESPDLAGRERSIRKLLLASARMLSASRSLNDSTAPHLALVAGGQDFITRTYLQDAEPRGIASVVRWDLAARRMTVSHPRNPREVLTCDLMVEALPYVGTPPVDWPGHISTTVQSVTTFLSSALDPVSV